MRQGSCLLAVVDAVLRPGFFRSRAALQMSKKSHHWQALLAAELLQLSSLFWHISLQRSGRFDQSRQDRIFRLKCYASMRAQLLGSRD